MCGLAGIVGRRSDRDLKSMLEAISHRGPDGMGTGGGDWFSAGMQRLAIRDAALGDQPFLSPNGRVQVFMNGEVYNFKTLRQGLAGKFAFKTDCDTEVVLALYTLHGIAGMRQLEGIYAIVIFDGDRMYALRDPFGIKPFYYTFLHDGQLAYCSEIKGLLPIARDLAFDEATAADSLVQGYPSDYATYFGGVHGLAPGGLLTVERGREAAATTQLFFERVSIAGISKANDFGLSQVTKDLQALLLDALKSQTTGEVRCDFALSGGVDSSTLVALASSIEQHITAHVIADSATNPDYVHAHGIARARSVQLSCTEFSYDEYLDALPGSVWIEERPTSFSAAPFQFLARSVASSTKVIISGEGADELFGGYRCYLEGAARAGERLGKALALERGGLAPRLSTIKAAERESHAASATEYAELMFDRIFWGRLQANHLELADRYFMASSVECRVPFLDEKLVSYVANLPLKYRVDFSGGVQKVALRCLLASQGPMFAYCSLRRKQGLPAAASLHLRRLGVELERYTPQYLPELAQRIGVRGAAALSWDLFHTIFVNGQGSKPSPRLARELAIEQGIRLGDIKQ